MEKGKGQAKNAAKGAAGALIAASIRKKPVQFLLMTVEIADSRSAAAMRIGASVE